jgi:hypothetical protein
MSEYICFFGSFDDLPRFSIFRNFSKKLKFSKIFEILKKLKTAATGVKREEKYEFTKFSKKFEFCKYGCGTALNKQRRLGTRTSQYLGQVTSQDLGRETSQDLGHEHLKTWDKCLLKTWDK